MITFWQQIDSQFTKIKKEAFKPLFFIKVEADTGRPGSGLVNHL